MAIHNQIILYGQITAKPRITKDENGNYMKGFCSITVAPGTRDFGLLKNKKNMSEVQFCKIPIITGNPDRIAEMDEFEIGDIVLMKTTFVTRNIVKKKQCPVCKTVLKKRGLQSFANPIHISIEKRGLSIEEGEMYLRRHCEISNVATIMGTLCRDPEIVYDDKRGTMAKFQLAIDRKYFIADDNIETRTDYPWVKIHGKERVDDIMLRCRQNTVVFIDGFIRVVKPDDIVVDCPNPTCSSQMTWNDWAMEIVPYAIEYIRNWVTDEELIKEEKKEDNEILQSVGININ